MSQGVVYGVIPSLPTENEQILGVLREELQGLAATVALVFLTAHGLVRFAPWLHQEWGSLSS